MSGKWRIIDCYQSPGDVFIFTKTWVVEGPDGEIRRVVTDKGDDETAVGRSIAKGEFYDTPVNDTNDSREVAFENHKVKEKRQSHRRDAKGGAAGGASGIGGGGFLLLLVGAILILSQGNSAWDIMFSPPSCASSVSACKGDGTDQIMVSPDEAERAALVSSSTGPSSPNESPPLSVERAPIMLPREALEQNRQSARNNYCSGNEEELLLTSATWSKWISVPPRCMVIIDPPPSSYAYELQCRWQGEIATDCKNYEAVRVRRTAQGQSISLRLRIMRTES